jgi:hypothetical protein
MLVCTKLTAMSSHINTLEALMQQQDEIGIQIDEDEAKVIILNS